MLTPRTTGRAIAPTLETSLLCMRAQFRLERQFTVARHVTAVLLSIVATEARMWVECKLTEMVKDDTPREASDCPDAQGYLNEICHGYDDASDGNARWECHLECKLVLRSMVRHLNGVLISPLYLRRGCDWSAH